MLGATFVEVSASEKERLDIKQGLQVSDIEYGKLKEAGVREGFIITRIDKKPVNDIEDIEDALDNASGGVLIEGVYPNGRRGYYGVGL
jgi:S1-C subfamily serine protease